MNERKTTLGMELLESRALPSSSPWGGWGGFFSPSPAVQADLAKIQTDSQTLHTDLVNLAPTLKADNKALQAAISSAIANDPSVATAEAALKSDISTWETTLQADWKAIWDATSSTTRKAAFTQLKTDLTSTSTAIKADHTAVQTAINDDSGVEAAQSQLKTDSAPITADQATLQADYQQLQKDLQSQFSSNLNNLNAARW